MACKNHAQAISSGAASSAGSSAADVLEFQIQSFSNTLRIADTNKLLFIIRAAEPYK